MRTTIALLAATLMAAPAFAQTAATPGTGGAAVPPASSPITPGTMATPGMNTAGTMPGPGIVKRQGTAGKIPDPNQAVATSSASAPQPARGRSSYTMGQARRQLEGQGFRNVTGLKRDAGGVWRGKAMRDGAETPVWLDYKGNFGQ